MKKRVATKIVHRDRYYFVIVRLYRSILGFRVWIDRTWHQTEPRFLSKSQAALLALHIEDYLKGKYKPVAAK